MSIDSYRQLVKVLDTPPMFTNILSLIIKEEDYELLLGLSETERSVIELNISNKYFQKAKNYFERILEVDSER